jgi:N-acyl-D-amino-acid deacylase
MATYDVVIRGGTVVDGTGIPKYRADLAIKDGRVALISGRIKAGGAQELDATGCMVAPGAVDLHTHYDAQLNWDPYASLSGWFGVTSVSIGQCGFGFAPTRPEDRELNMRMMNRIEAIPLTSFRSTSIAWTARGWGSTSGPWYPSRLCAAMCWVCSRRGSAPGSPRLS